MNKYVEAMREEILKCTEDIKTKCGECKIGIYLCEEILEVTDKLEE